MPYIAGIICWVVLSASGGGSPLVGIVVGILTTVVIKQGRRLADLEERSGTFRTEVPQREVTPSEPSVPVFMPFASAPTAPEQYDYDLPPLPSFIEEAESEPVPKPIQQPLSPRPAPLPRKPQRSTFETVEQMFGTTIANFLLRGNPIARIGVVVLFFGVGFFLKYVNDLGFFPIELRLLASALLALFFIGLGWKLQSKQKQFAVTMQGAGAGIFYITVFIAFKLYHLIPSPLAFAFLLGITVIAAALAIIQNARSLAFLAITGGFLAPALASSGGGSHLLLFSYFAILNLGVFAMSWYRSWREINIVGFLFTLVLSSLWGLKYYTPRFFPSVEPFLIFFVVLYAVISILLVRRQPDGKSDALDTALVFGTPFFGFALQSRLVYQFEYGMALSAVGFGAIYIALARVALGKLGEKARVLVESYFSIGVCFLTLAVPLAFDGRLTSAVWALEAVAILWSGVRQKRFLACAAALVLLIFSSLAFLSDSFNSVSANLPILNSWFLGVAMLTSAHILAALILSRAKTEELSLGELSFANWPLGIALLWWFIGGIWELERHSATIYNFALLHLGWLNTNRTSTLLNIYALYIGLSVGFFWILGRKVSLSPLTLIKNFASPLLLAILLGINLGGIEPISGYGIVTWPSLLLIHYAILWVEDREDLSKPRVDWQHTFGLWLATLFLSSGTYWIVHRLLPESSAWPLGGLGIVAALISVYVTAAVDETRWPFSGRRALYLEFSLTPILFWLLCWPFWLDLFHNGSAAPLPYLAFLNPLDIAQLAALGALLHWTRKVSASPPAWLPTLSQGWTILGIWSFVWLTATLLRSIHHYSGVPWEFDYLFNSNLVQAALSIFWSILALILTLLGHRKGLRGPWKTGAVLLIVVVTKLFLVDLSGRGTLARIVAFLGTGLLMLLIGYLAPIPPEKVEKEIEK